MSKISVLFNTELLRGLIEKRNGTVDGFSKDFARFGYSVTRQAVQLWLIGRKPRVEAIVFLSDYFNEPMENFFLKKYMASYRYLSLCTDNELKLGPAANDE